MFEFIRKHTKFMQVLLFLLILPSFVLFGIEGYTRNTERGDVVAVVDGREIAKSEWDSFHQREATRIRESNREIDPKLLDSAEARYASLERLVNERLLSAAADKFRMTTSDQRLARDLNENQSISAIRKADGSIDMQRYAQLLASQGLSPEMFEAQVRRDIAVRQVLNGLTLTSFATGAIVDRSLGAYYERREAQLLRLPVADYIPKISLTDHEVKSYYEANLNSFQAPETADIEYLVLDLPAIERTLQIKPEDLQQYYEQNKASFADQEQRRASHILLAAGKDASAAAKAQARAKAAEILTQVRAKPSTFSDVAKAKSEDGGSKEQGGDLDFFGRGSMVKPFEDAVFSMKKGDISDIVETDFGYHIIQLTDIKEGQKVSFEQLRPKIEADVRKRQAQAKFAELAEPFSNSVFENPDTLKTTAERFGLSVQSQAGVRRLPPPGLTQGPLSNAKFLEALFSGESIAKKGNTAGIEIGNSQIVSGRIVKYSPARQQTLDEVLPRAKALATQARAATLARADGEKALSQLRAGESVLGLTPATVISRDFRSGAERQPQKLVDAVMRADAAKLPAFAGVDVPGFGYVVAKVSRVLPRDTRTTDEQLAEKRQLGDFIGSAEARAYMNLLKDKFKVSIKVDKPSAKKPEGEGS